MRIAHVSDCYLPRLGGIELQVRDLAARQAAAHDVTILTTTTGDGASARLDLADRAVEVVRLGVPAGRRPSPEDIRYRWSAEGPALLAGREFDVVHVHASSFSPLAFLAARDASRRGVPTVATVHSLWAKATPLFRGADLLAGWGRWQVAWSAVSNAAAAPLRSIAGRHGAVAILPNGVDPAEWQVDHIPGPPGELRIVAVSRLAPRKRVMQLVRILARVRRQLPAHLGLHVEILGDGPQRDEIQGYLAARGMEAWVHLRGRCSRSEIRSVLARSDLFVAPARLESFGIAALEARCAGLPVVALAGTGVSDFIEHGREGWLVDSDSAMAGMLFSLARSPEMVARVAAHNRVVAPSVDWSVVDAKWEALYRRATLEQGRQWRLTPAKESISGPMTLTRPGAGRVGSTR